MACSDGGQRPSEPVGTGGAGGGAGTGAQPAETSSPDARFIPTPSGPCPELVEGTVTFAPAGIPERDVRIYVGDEAESADGPLVFYWHGTGSSPMEAQYGLGNAMSVILAEGGLVAAPYHDPDAGTWPWFLTVGSGPEDDLLVADEVLACAIETVGVDLRRIHSIGMSAGGLQTAQMSYRRSGYLASVVTYSGGRLGDPPLQEENNPFPAMIVHGGPGDVAVVSFQELSESYRDDLRARGHFAFICDHGGGHVIAPDIRVPAGQFFAAHPFGTVPSPYEDGLPDGFPAYCAP